jgi:hypothetical protein
MEPQDDFLKSLVVQAIECNLAELYKKISYCHVIGHIIKKPLKLKTDVRKDPGFFRRYLYFLKIVDSEHNLDYLGKDYGKEDIFQFDEDLAKTVFAVSMELDDYIGEVSKELKLSQMAAEKFDEG